MEDRQPFNNEIRKDIKNFEDNLEAELLYLLNKYNPTSFDVFVNRADPGRRASAKVQMTFE